MQINIFVLLHLLYSNQQYFKGLKYIGTQYLNLKKKKTEKLFISILYIFEDKKVILILA